MDTTPVAGTPQVRLRWLLDSSPSRPAWLDDDEWVPRGERRLYSRVKHGLYTVLESMERTGTVLLPAYVPGGVTWAALAAGHDVRYYPVREDLSLPADAVADRIAETDAVAVVFVHYFGFVDDAFADLVGAARDHDALVIEDCARGLFARDPDHGLLGSTGDVALFCLHKTLPTPNGGLTVSRAGTPPAPHYDLAEWDTVPRVAAKATAHGLGLRMSSSPVVKRPNDRQPNAVSPEGSRPGIGSVSRRVLSRCDPREIRIARQSRYRVLRNLLSDNDAVDVVSPPASDVSVPFGVAALAESDEVRRAYLQRLYQCGLPCEVLTWPPVYRHEAAMADKGAETLRSRLFVLPTHQQLDPGDVGRMAACLRDSR